MDNGSKIKDDLFKIKNTFLKKRLEDYDGQPQSYILEEEFSKTKKNKDIFFKLLFSGFILLIILGTLFITTWINERSRKIKISIDDFKDITLKDLLTSSKKYESQLTMVQNELDDVNYQKNSEIQIIKDKSKKQIELTNQKRIKEDNKQKIIKTIKTNEWDNIQVIQKKYNKEIKEKESEISDIKKQISKLDKTDYNQAKQKQDILSSDDKINDLQTKRLTNFYEEKIKRLTTQYDDKIKDLNNYYKELLSLTVLKYNPIYEEDDDAAKVLNSPFDPNDDGRNYKISDQTIYNEHINTLKSNGITTDEQLKSIIKKSSERNLIISYLNDIPFENAVPKLIQRLNTYDTAIMNEYRFMLNNVIEVNKKTSIPQSKEDELLKNYTTLIDNMIDKSVIPNDKKYVGYVLNSENKDNLTIKLEPGFIPKNNQTAYILSKTNKILSKILFVNDKSSIKVKITEMNDKIDPLDTILIDK